ncbi:DUF6090 family protein [Robiginitalea aurantiaca]|uniref:DUF6090 family protein n=1 Tax=Robiginitalea aurantiaca TaxID=3056915 RepID=A0ABT7WBG4_9FLAO|nr:DUF6090 family protein [Robiginitalea aurantiaca]MDM9630253.1 DUF6090 family protein [Robiginitalea aurantiaca]
MFHFMHKIRQGLLTENRFTKYLLYAIVEILIVIIGILIAIELDNWNEARQSRIDEIEVYKEIRQDLQLSLKELELGMNSHLVGMMVTIDLIDYLKSGKSEHPISSTRIQFYPKIDKDHQFFPGVSGFEALNSVGLKTLTNDKLRRDITNLYQLDFRKIVAMGRDNSSARSFEFLTPLIQQYIDLSDSAINITPPVINELDFPPDSIMIHEIKLVKLDEMRRDRELLLGLQNAVEFRQLKAGSYLVIIEKVRTLIEAIDIEVDKLEDQKSFGHSS